MTTTTGRVTEAADALETLQAHLARYADRLGALATHLEVSHKATDVAAMVLSDDPYASLTGRHERAHQAAIDAAKAELDAAQEEAADAWADPPYDAAPERAICPRHGETQVTGQSSYTGFAGGRCYLTELECGCTDADESADIAAAY